jgi:hypothetical protein
VFAALGYDCTLVGRLGDPIRPEFADYFADAELVTVGETTQTDYVQFDDRRLLLTEPNRQDVDWETLERRLGVDALASLVDGADVLSFGALTSTPSIYTVLRGFLTEVWPRLDDPPTAVHFSPGRLEPVTRETIERGLSALAALDDAVPVTVTVNREQSRRLVEIAGRATTDSSPTTAAQTLRERIGVSRVVVHTFDQAASAGPDGVAAVRTPSLATSGRSRSVDEHFESGIALALAEGLSDGAALILANAVAGHVLRHDAPPDEASLREFVDSYESHLVGES